MSLDPLAQLQADFTARLNSLAYFVDIEVISLSGFAKDGDVEPESVASLIERHNLNLAGLNPKGGKCGAAILVPLPALEGVNPDVPGPQLDLRFAVQIAVNPLVNAGTNGTGKALSAIALQVMQAGHHFQIANVAGLTVGKDAFQPDVDADNGLLVGVVMFETRLQLAQPAAVLQPTLSVAANVTLACATPGASLYFTTNESLPWSGNAAATLYSAPFAKPAAGTVLRVAAYKSGSNGSNVLWHVLL